VVFVIFHFCCFLLCFRFLQTCFVGLFLAGCLVLHTINYSNDHSAFGFNTFFSFSGELPLVIAFSSFSPSEGLLYNFMILFPLAFFLFSICFKLSYEDKIAKHLDAMEIENTHPYSKEVLAVWDFNLASVSDNDEYSGNIVNKLLQLLEETLTMGKKKKRSQYEIFKVYFRRFLGMFYYVLLVGASFSVIIYVTISSSAIAASASQISFLKNFTPFIVTIILNLINGITPTILQKLTEVEGWDSAQTVANIVLFRLYVSNLLNALILAASYIVLADPFLLAEAPSVRNSVSVKVSNGFSCRYDQVASGLFTLVILTWALDLAFFFGTPFLTSLYMRYTAKPAEPTSSISSFSSKSNINDKNSNDNSTDLSSASPRESDSKSHNVTAHQDEKHSKSEFIVAPNMIKRLNFIGLNLLALPFCPFLLILLPILLFCGFKLEKLILKYYYTKPSRPWKGGKAGFIYTSLYLISFLCIGITVNSYFFISKTFAKSCELQDQSIGLCLDGTYDSTAMTCSFDTSSKFYSYYGGTSYPKAVCLTSCGPFVDVSNNLTPFHSLISNIFILKILWSISFSYPYFPWISMIIVIMVILLKRNTIEVMKIISFNKERNMESQILSLEAERKKQIKIINKLKTIETSSVSKQD
jgi:hypothetical protein